MNRTQVAEAFATQAKPRGRASALYYDGRVAFSYGEHFPLAIITTKPGGPRTATVNTDKYSNTTARHKGMIRRALAAEGFTITDADTATMRELRRHV